MNRSDVSELHYIVRISNLPSILQHGILSHDRAERLKHDSIAMPEIQDIRTRKVVPGSRPLHEYVNLYFHARNPMLFKRKDQHRDLCILCVNHEVLDLFGVIIADGNAASTYTGFWPSPDGLQYVERDLVFAQYWTDEDIFLSWHKKRVRCAEVLVPDRVAPELISSAYVSCEETQNAIHELALPLDIHINSHLFFR